MEKRKLGPSITFFPQPMTLIGSVSKDNEQNLMAASWVGIISKTPPTVSVSIHKGRTTRKNIAETGVFSVNMVPESMANEADFCGLSQGRSIDKAKTADIKLAAADHIAAPLVEDSPLVLECKVVQEIEFGDYVLIAGEILETHANVPIEGELKKGNFEPLVYLGGIREYWSLGEKVADAYRSGKVFLPAKES